MRIYTLLPIIAFAAACGNNSVKSKKGDDPIIVVNNDVADMGDVRDSGGSSDTGTVVIPDAMMVPGGPAILELSTNVMRLTENQSLVISALVTDDDGVDDIVGGRVLDAGSSAVYGNFDGGQGSYTFDLSWGAIHQVSSIDFTVEAPRVVTVEFLDTSGNRATRSLSLTLHCDGQPACDGRCGENLCDGFCQSAEAFMFDPMNCGRCGNACGDTEQCSDGQCQCPLDVCGAACVDRSSDVNHCGTCNRACAAGKACINGECGDHNAGGPCNGPQDCPDGGDCFDEATIGIPGGVCAYFCDSDANCPGDSRCATYMEGFKLCAQTCTSSAQCRDGFSCGPTQEGFNACAPPM